MHGFRVMGIWFWITFMDLREIHKKGAMASNQEKRLLYFLFNDTMIKQMRPVQNDSQAVTVTLGLTLSQLVTLDAKKQILTTSVWIRQIWYNPYLKWNTSDFGGLKSINVSPNIVWKPDITLYNNAEGDNDFGGSMDKLSTRVILHHSGKNTWLSPAMIHSKCNIDITYFPFDTQKCKLKFGSWTYDGFRLDLRAESNAADLSKYTTNAEWKMVSMPAQRNEINYICCPEPYPDVTYTIVIRRRTLFYLMNLILPLVMISSLSALTFLVPPETGERVSLAITILLSMTVFMLLVNDMIPPTSDVVPLVAKFYTAAMMEMTIALVFGCYNLSLHHNDPAFHKMPKWIKVHVLGWVATLFGVGKLRKETKALSHGQESELELRLLEKIMDEGLHDEEVELARGKSDNNSKLEMVNLCRDTKSFSGRTRSSYNDTRHSQKRDHDSKSSVYCSMESDSSFAQSQLIDKVERLLNNSKEDDQIKMERMEWKRAAMTLDKFFLWLFLFILLATVVWCFGQAPGYVA